MARWPFRIPVTRLVGTFSWRASSAALMWSAFSSSARCSPGGISMRAMYFSLVILHDFDTDRPGRTVWPLKTDPPLVVDANAVLALPVAAERFEAVARQAGKVHECRGRLQTVELELRGPLNRGTRLDSLAGGEGPGSFVPIPQDHLER